MRRLSFWFAVGGVSVLSNIVWQVATNKIGSPGLAKLTSYKNGS